jgi:hypothetical protein
MLRYAREVLAMVRFCCRILTPAIKRQHTSLNG